MNRPAVTVETRWRFPEPVTAVLPNGLTIVAFDLPGQPIAAVDLVLGCPLDLEPPTREGVATVTLHSADEGTQPHPEGALADELELIGAALHGSAGQHHSLLGLDVPTTQLPRAIELLAEVVRLPLFAEADLDRHIEQQLAGLDALLASPTAATRQAFRTAMFGADDRRGRPGGGRRDTLAELTRADAVAWHRDRWVASNATLVIAGASLGQDLRALAAPLADWQPGPAEPDLARAVVPAPDLVLVDFPDAVQATMQVGTLTIGRQHPDWAALKVAGHALVGAFASRINLELRERRGDTYGIGGGASPRPSEGLFSLGGSLSVDAAAESLSFIVDAIAAEQAFTAEEIADARSYLIGVAPLAHETASDIARQAAVLAAAHTPIGFVNDLQAAMRVVTAEAATAALRKHVRPDQLTIAIGGPAEVLEPQLRGVGFDPRSVTPLV